MMRLLAVLPWALLWGLGGLWLAGAAFRLGRAERILVGLVVGLAAQTLLANLFSRWLPLAQASYGAAGVTAAAGLAALFFPGWQAPWREKLLPPLAWKTWLALAALSLLSFSIARGLAVFDEFLQLPVISSMAAGAIPPRFPLDPATPYEYHYFLLLPAAQLLALGQVPPWAGYDLMRGLAAGLALCLAFRWGRRLTGSPVAGALSAAFLAFASGTRWLLLLLPERVLQVASRGVQLLGSGAASGESLSAALSSPWAIDGHGPIPFPFAYANGLQPPGVILQYVANGLSEHAFTLTLLLVFSRRRGWVGSALCALLFAAMGLFTEAGVVLSLGGLGLALLPHLLRRGRGIPRSWLGWLAVVLGGHLLGSWQGGALWGIALRALGFSAAADYHTIIFRPVFPPELVSAHLGVLSLFNPGQLLIALAEAGPLLVGLPLLLRWGWKAARAERWVEAALTGEAALALLMLFVRFDGSEGVRNTARLYRFFHILILLSVPLAWNRLRGARWLGLAEPRLVQLRAAYLALAVLCMLGGLGMFLVELPAIKAPVYSTFITEMDARIQRHQWNRLEADALVFDLVPYRAVTLLGRFTRSSHTWYELSDSWKALSRHADPAALAAAGYRYAYWDQINFAAQPAAVQAAWEAGSCATMVEEAAYEGFWRRLYDLADCR